jgi:enamine deaminase RidA (YjgF/YER057c/UK114 family)
MEILQPPDWPRPKGYANGIMASGRMIFLSGMIGWDGDGVFHTDSLVGQTHQVLTNIVRVLAEAGAGPEHIVRMTWYVVDRDEYLAAQRELGEAYRAVIGRHFPAMTAVAVTALMEARALVEIEVTAMLP